MTLILSSNGSDSATSPTAPGELRAILSFVFDLRAPPLEVAAFKKLLVDCPTIVHAIEVSGTYDFIVEAALEDMSHYHDWLSALSDRMSSLVSRCDTSFVCKRFVRRRSAERYVWVICSDGRKRIDASLIDKIVAEGDYMRIHSRGASWLTHCTMCSLMRQLDGCGLVRIHRSTAVRMNFIERVVHAGRHWSARLDDGTSVRIADSNVNAVMQQLKTVSSLLKPALSKAAELVAQ